MMVNNLKLRELDLSDAGRASSFKERAARLILQVKLRNLELACIRDLFDAEIHSFTKNSKNDKLFKESLIRMCLYYESASSLASSIFENSAKLTGEILQWAYGEEIECHSLHDQARSRKIFGLDPQLAGFLDRLNPALLELSIEDGELNFNVTDLVELVDTPDDHSETGSRALDVAERVKIKVDGLFQLVQDYLGFMDSHLVEKLSQD